MRLKFCLSLVSLTWTLLLPTAAHADGTHPSALEQAIRSVESSLPAEVGMAVLDTGSGAFWSYRGDRRVALTSTFKTLACAKLLHDAEHDPGLLTRTLVLRREQLVSYSPVTEKFVDAEISPGQACAAAMHMSDNTAANLVIEATGGPGAITTFLRSLGDDVSRLDRVEPALNEAVPGDPRDTTTPAAMTRTLQQILFGSVLSPASRQQLLQWMKDSRVTRNLLRSVLPKGWQIADRSGAGGFGARGITAVLWPEGRAPLIVSIYLSQTEASLAERDRAIVRIGQALFATDPATLR